jgi:hypothetical protein
MKVYGYYPSDFSQWMRSGGFRPVVFTQHGLELAFIVSLAVICAVVLVRARGRIFGQHAGLIAGYLGVLLVLCKSLGPLLYAIVTAPIILFTRPRTWARIALTFTLLLCSYPVLRYHGWVPGQVISSTAGSISADRSASFQTRYENEGKLLFKANQKPLFGWGTWGRNRVFDKFTGQDISITDGGWIIQFGMFGWLGYLSLFGLIATSLWSVCRTIGDKVTPESVTLGGLALVAGIYVIDQIPNANPLSLIFLLSGSIAARATATRRRASARSASIPNASQPAAVER